MGTTERKGIHESSPSLQTRWQEIFNNLEIQLPPLPSPETPITPRSPEIIPSPNYYSLPQLKHEILTVIEGITEYHARIIPPPRHIEADLAVPLQSQRRLFKKNPTLPENLIGAITSLDLIASAEVTESGFLNIKVDLNRLAEAVLAQIDELGDAYGEQNIGNGRIVVIDYSSPNIAKRMGLGHLRSTVIGDSLRRIYEACGFTVIGDNHLGDWGTQFGILGYAIETSERGPSELSMEDLVRMYIEANKQAEADPSFIEASKQWFKSLEEGDENKRQLWKEMVRISKEDFKKIYEMLGIRFHYHLGESFYIPMIPSLLAALTNLGIINVEEDGSMSADLRDKGLGKIILLKSDGASLYATRDLATLVARLGWFDPAHILYVVGKEQEHYFKQVFEVFRSLLERIGVDQNEIPTLEHIKFGHIRLTEGRLSTRKGRMIYLEDIINSLFEEALKFVNRDKSRVPPKRRPEIATKIAVGALKFNDLQQSRIHDIVIPQKVSQMISLEKGTGPYVQYTYVRAHAVLQRARAGKGSRYSEMNEIIIENPDEKKIVLLLARYPETVRKAFEKNEPSIIANFLIELSSAFNSFYEGYTILNNSTRIHLTTGVTQVIKNGLSLLGIETPEAM